MDKKQIFNLAAKASSGDEEAFEILLNEKAQHILYSAYDILKNIHDAEDAAQDIVVKMYQYIGNLKESDNFNAWLHKIIQNECITKLRKNKHYKNDLDVETIMDTAFSESLIEKDREFLPHAFAEDESLSKILLDVISDLPGKRRRAIFLYYYEDLSQNEIAEIMGVSENTVASNIIRARSDIKKKLEAKTGMDIDDGIASQTTKFAALPVLGQVFTADAVARFDSQSVARLVNMDYKGVADSSSATGHSSNPGLKVAAMVTLVGLICASAFIAADVPTDSQPQVTEPAVIEQPAKVGMGVSSLDVGGKVKFVGGDCDCGHENPKRIVLEYDDSKVTGKLEYKWEILKDSGGVVANGSGKSIEMSKRNISAGEYTAKYMLTDTGDNLLVIERDFEIK